ncbi:hypothetical protein [Planococcus alpniumensis]|uniref:hypothetical protein n=1 Tax=Planococcus alpniumensis TaxID=2708345 RepID=UPI001B8AE28E|nr:hypothetical protein [Planococcus sp. MSAK28401]
MGKFQLARGSFLSIAIQKVEKRAIALASGFVMGLSCPVTLKIKGFSAIVNKET